VAKTKHLSQIQCSWKYHVWSRGGVSFS